MASGYPLRLFAFTIICFSSFSIAAAQAGKSDVCPRAENDFAAIQQKAAAKDPVAQTALASCYDLGQHVQPDEPDLVRGHHLVFAAAAVPKRYFFHTDGYGFTCADI